ncbi:hypothetical protein HMPREF9156_00392 [Scardovia wiggsiae F0424]|uniref:Uncharacterized protein n=1 Tax=Scardovia wiggsiae F0424 TaxID=857290 RepID=J0DH01_9BIFI|nr:TraX family protein [Scardovia wiggsiae]EJD65628.1 hypothetical protein HMPREF9156_00392 [Scardovia wiggsiae F0424]
MPTSSELKKKRRHRGNSDYRLSCFVILFMVLSMLGSSLVRTGSIDPSKMDMFTLTVAVLCEALSWMALPIAAWLFVKHFETWGMKLQYSLILLAVAALSEVPYDFVSTGQWVTWETQNPLWALAVCSVVLAAWDWLGRFEEFTRWIWRIIAIIGALTWAYVFRLGLREHILYQGIALIGFVVIFHALKSKENTMVYIAGAWGALFLLAPGIGVLFLHARNDEEKYPAPPFRWMLVAAYPLLLAAFAAVRYLVY